MSAKPIDTFVTNSVKLFEANPSQTSFTILYQYRSGPSESKKDNKKVPEVSFRTHNGSLSTNYKFTTRKSKDVSRLLSALGPKGVTITVGKVGKKVRKSVKGNQDNVTKTKKKKTAKKNETNDVIGLSTLLVNTEVREYVPVPEVSTRAQVGDSKESSSKKKKSKSKNKKKR